MATHPLFFQPNRVWRCYSGGTLLDKLRNTENPSDGNFPEDWLASATRAVNGPHSQHPDEGLSRVRTTDGTAAPLLTDALKEQGAQFLRPGATGDGVGVLCKFLDSAVRLPIQCHPDRAFAREYYHSPYGKTEVWMILNTRTVNGVEPYLLMGFKEGIDPDSFKRAVQRQDIPAMEASLHRVPVKPGDIFLIPGRFPHAIGPGVLMLEVQEPSDWVVQPERSCAGTMLTDKDMWGPLDPDAGLKCFDYDSASCIDATLSKVRICPEKMIDYQGGCFERIIGPDQTDCFTVDRLTVEKDISLELKRRHHIGIATEGRGRIVINHQAYPVTAGDSFLIPYDAGDISCYADDSRFVVYLVSAPV